MSLPDSPKRSLRGLYPYRLDIALLIIASAVLLWIGFHEPILTVRKLWAKNTFSIWAGVQSFWLDRNYFLASVIFFFSMIFPVAKLAGLALAWLVPLTVSQRRWLLFWLATLGRWSMLDVLVAAVLIVSVKLGVLAEAKIENGIYYFAASILSAMTVSTLIDYLAHKKVIKGQPG